MASTRRDVRRRIEQLAAHPTCAANVLSAALDVPMKSVAEAEGVELNPEGQSPFAIQRGVVFERSLFENRGAQLREALTRAGVLPEGLVGFDDVRQRRQGGPIVGVEAALKVSERLLRLARGPRVVAGLALPVEAVSGVVVLDALLIQPDGALQVLEIKSFPDRGGYTDRTKLAATRAQAGLYVHVLQQVAAQLGRPVREDGVLVLVRPGRALPEVRGGEDLRYQALRAARALTLLRDAAATPPDDRLGAVRAASVHYGEACFRFCARARGCRAEAAARGEGAVLGEGVGRALGAITLPRAAALLRGACPESPTERDLARRLQALTPVGVGRGP